MSETADAAGAETSASSEFHSGLGFVFAAFALANQAAGGKGGAGGGLFPTSPVVAGGFAGSGAGSETASTSTSGLTSTSGSGSRFHAAFDAAFLERVARSVIVFATSTTSASPASPSSTSSSPPSTAAAAAARSLARVVLPGVLAGVFFPAGVLDRIARRDGFGAGEFIILLDGPLSSAFTSPPSAAAIALASIASKSTAGGAGPTSPSASASSSASADPASVSSFFFADARVDRLADLLADAGDFFAVLLAVVGRSSVAGVGGASWSMGHASIASGAAMGGGD